MGRRDRMVVGFTTACAISAYHHITKLWAVVFAWQLDLQQPVQSVHITINVISSNLAHYEVYPVQHYVIKFVSDLRQVGGFLHVHLFFHQ